jgi:tetratricopeptide (TPR) repeat protein
MGRRRVLTLPWLGIALASVILLLAGCGGSSPPPQPPAPLDQDLMSGWRLARFAFEQGQYDEAAVLYARVLERAYARDDLRAIGEVGYELAVVRLRQHAPRAAAEQAMRTREELRRRGAAPFGELLLVEAVALYEAGDRDGAEDMAVQAVELAPAASDPLIDRALFLRGRIAADRADAAGVSRALAQLGDTQNAQLRADRLELLGRLNLLEDRPESGLPAFRESVDLRRDVEDYVGMARALALAGEAAQSTGRVTEAADLYFRAGRSAGLQGNRADARRWLESAARLAAKTEQAEILSQAEERLEGLNKANAP